jgi:hypothetical protein
MQVHAAILDSQGAGGVDAGDPVKGDDHRGGVRMLCV